MSVTLENPSEQRLKKEWFWPQQENMLIMMPPQNGFSTTIVENPHTKPVRNGRFWL